MKKIYQRIKSRFADWHRERRIKEIAEEIIALRNRGAADQARVALEKLGAEIEARSALQVVRIERRRNLR